MSYVELNLDGLPGPAHNFGGVAVGNLASEQSKAQVSHPKLAALQSLAKMKWLHDLGIPQAVLPPHPRPHLEALRQLGFADAADAFQRAPEILYACSSSSAMWTANAATVSPAPDTADGRVHFTPANLNSQFHRSLETSYTAKLLKAVFPEGPFFHHHDPLPSCATYRDEGAANHLRFAPSHGEPGVEVFVWGDPAKARKFPSRQSRLAGEAIARRHGLRNALFLEQNPAAIDAGAFHNDVVAVSNERVLFCHEEAFVEGSLDRLRDAYPHVWVVEVSANDLSLADAVNTYLFNSQLVTLPNGRMDLIAPEECDGHPGARNVISRLFKQCCLLREVHFQPLRESMKNGGGPACLRLRVVLSEEALAAMHPGVRFSPDLYEALTKWVDRNYRDDLTLADLATAELKEECDRADRELLEILKLTPARPEP